MKKGMVALVGAGPGEVSLLTVRAKELIEMAEVVLYDRLVSADILALIPPTAQKINVGKENNHHPVPQHEINARLLQAAQSGNLVVRLKGGDPYVFGRGGEELELLVANNIPFEVVPGITSAIAAPSFAGIPVTHRDFCSSFHVITGHQKKNEPLNIDFESLVRTKGTLIFLMGVSSLAAITEGLLQTGMAGDMPAAMVEQGTRANQRKVVATLNTLQQAAQVAEIKSPAIIIVGKVCSLSVEFDWFTARPLYGKEVVVTSPAHSGNRLASMLKAQTAMVHSMPAVAIAPCMEQDALAEIIAQLAGYTWLVFSSKNGVALFFAALAAQGKDARSLAHLQIAAVGASTAQSLQAHGIVADYIPAVYAGQSLAEGLLEKLSPAQDTLLLLRAQGADDALPRALTEASIAYTDKALYGTQLLICPEYQTILADLAQRTAAADSRWYTCFTSASTVHAFMKNNPDTTQMCGICIGKQTAAAAQEYRLNYHVAQQATLQSMVDTLLEVAQ